MIMSDKNIKELTNAIQQLQSSTGWPEIMASVLSVLAIMISIISIIEQRKINRTNLQSTYFKEIFSDYLLHKIPDAASKINFNNKGYILNNYKTVNKIFMDMIKKCGYYKYAKNDFYVQLIQMTKDLEDKLVSKNGICISDINEQNLFLIMIHQDVMNIIKFINKNYHKF